MVISLLSRDTVLLARTGTVLPYRLIHSPSFAIHVIDALGAFLKIAPGCGAKNNTVIVVAVLILRETVTGIIVP